MAFQMVKLATAAIELPIMLRTDSNEKTLQSNTRPENDPQAIAKYKWYHEKVWPEITQSLKDVGVENLEIYLLGTRMFMIMEVNELFSFEAKNARTRRTPKCRSGNGSWESFSSPSAGTTRREVDVDERVFKLEQ